jgi:hypothetical protein
MKFLVESLVVENYPLDEAIIKHTRRLLIEHLEHEDNSGEYHEPDEAAPHGARLENDPEYERRVRGAKRLKLNWSPPVRLIKRLYFSKFVRGASVPIYKKFVEHYAKGTEWTEERKRIFHIDLAAKYHPFEDGNGRSCRLLMNAILLKYTGMVVTILHRRQCC